uniref:Uncharacterized protein n=1 Tax=Triticum urartu TaxID=4572 RepID=A0A8R7TL90_TRIUA
MTTPQRGHSTPTRRILPLSLSFPVPFPPLPTPQQFRTDALALTLPKALTARPLRRHEVQGQRRHRVQGLRQEQDGHRRRRQAEARPHPLLRLPG